MISSTRLETYRVIATLIGKRWQKNASGPDTFDCWGLVEYIFSLEEKSYKISHDFDHSETDLISNCMESHAQALQSNRVYEHEDFDIVLMYKDDRPLHVGIVIDGQVLHCMNQYGVCLHTFNKLFKMYSKFEYYRL